MARSTRWGGGGRFRPHAPNQRRNLPHGRKVGWQTGTKSIGIRPFKKKGVDSWGKSNGEKPGGGTVRGVTDFYKRE